MAPTTKPSRSDAVLDEEQQLHVSNQVRAHFDSLAPKRPSKPNRSETDTSPPPPPSSIDQPINNTIPELDKLRSLQSQSPPIVFGKEDHGVVEEEEEFVETRYYKELISIDKQHHTTGTGFISVTNENPEHNVIELPPNTSNNMVSCYKSNPSTNDWTPNLEDNNNEVYVSYKPSRSG